MGRIGQLVAGGTLAAGLVFAMPASAGAVGAGDCYVGCTPPVVSATSVPVSGVGGPNVQAVVVAPPTTAATPSGVGASSLPFTGTDIVELSLVGIGAVLTGGLLARRRRTVA